MRFEGILGIEVREVRPVLKGTRTGTRGYYTESRGFRGTIFTIVRNLGSFLRHASVVEDRLRKCIAEGYVQGFPLSEPSTPSSLDYDTPTEASSEESEEE